MAATAAAPVVIRAPSDTVAARILRFVARAPVHLVLAILGLLWLIPTLGLFITSILPQSTIASEGWWKIFSKPSVATW